MHSACVFLVEGSQERGNGMQPKIEVAGEQRPSVYNA